AERGLGTRLGIVAVPLHGADRAEPASRRERLGEGLVDEQRDRRDERRQGADDAGRDGRQDAARRRRIEVQPDAGGAEVRGRRRLYITGAVLSMDDIMEKLGISRGNVSMNLSKLVEWGLVRRVHKRGDRKDYYESLSDVWEMFTLVANQRKRREIDPILTTLRRCKEELSPEALGGLAE